MIPFGMIALGIFWIAAIRLWFADGPTIPVICIILWLAFYVGAPLLHLPGIIFVVAQTVLGVVLLLIERYKSAMT